MLLLNLFSHSVTPQNVTVNAKCNINAKCNKTRSFNVKVSAGVELEGSTDNTRDLK